jgi:hypothetical protein
MQSSTIAELTIAQRMSGVLLKEQQAMKRGWTMPMRRTSKEEEDDHNSKEDDCAAAATTTAAAADAPLPLPQPSPQAAKPAPPLLDLIKQWQQWWQHGVAACGGAQ